MNLISAAQWWCASTPPDAVRGPEQLSQVEAALEWWPAKVPGTVAGALRAAGRWTWGREDEELLDGRDWWFRTSFDLPPGGPWDLTLGGVATIGDVWLNRRHVGHGENMFVTWEAPVAQLEQDNELVIRCAALAPRLAARHPRPRYKSRLVRDQSLRWYRTTLLGRMPGWSRWAAPVGPWREVALRPRAAAGRLDRLDLSADLLPGARGRVAIDCRLSGGAQPARHGWLRVGNARSPLRLSPDGDSVRVQAELTLDEVALWWPHTHGDQPLYPVSIELDGESRSLRSVGFRTIDADREDGGFALRVNGRPCFCRGVSWGPADVVSLTCDADQLRRDLHLLRSAGLNLIRLGGFGVYEDVPFWDLCDELGIMVWQDCMLASVDPPDTPDYLSSLNAELREQFGALQGRPSLAVACGSSESYQQGAMLGLAPERYRSEVLEYAIPAALTALVPGVPYLPSTPSGGEPPIRTDRGVTHYFGVGAYLRPPADARLANVRFAAECLSFSNPPERTTINRIYGSAAVAGHDPRWKLAVARDAGTSWDFEDVREHYVASLFGLDPRTIRYRDPEYALDLGRAAIVELIGRVIGGWRAADSGCAGAIVLAWRDLWPGAGWGMLDSTGLPKSSFYALARACMPQALILRDRGLNGLAIDVHNDLAQPLHATLSMSLMGPGAVEWEAGERALNVEPGGQTSVDAIELLGGFRDLTAAWGISNELPDVVLARLTGADGSPLGRAVHFPAGYGRPREENVGLQADACRVGDREWALTLQAERAATFVSIDVEDFQADDSWFHLAPGETVSVRLRGTGSPRGTVRALNARLPSRIDVRDP